MKKLELAIDDGLTIEIEKKDDNTYLISFYDAIGICIKEIRLKAL